MMTKSTLLHLRIPFSYNLSPIFLLALTVSRHTVLWKALLVFIILHLFIYPASNGFNSYYDRDEESIGGLEKPPPVQEDLLRYSLLFDLTGVLLGMIINWQFALGLLIYGLASKSYSYDRIRLKKKPLISWLAVAFTQGAFTVLLIFIAIDKHGWELAYHPETLIAAFLSSLFLMAAYPMTQVYQHSEDSRRGDRTLSLLLGVRGTFIFTSAFFISATIGFILYYMHYYGVLSAVVFILSQFPTLIYFLTWFHRVWKDEKAADFTSTMRMNLISSTMLNLFFCLLILFIR